MGRQIQDVSADAVQPLVINPPAAPADDAEPIHLAWRSINCYVAGDAIKGQGGLREHICQSFEAKQVLRDCWGEACPGEVLAVMGPSGAGKTTLLNVLADRPTLGEHGTWSGSITLNGRPCGAHWKRAAAYVMQKDIFFEKLTVYDHLLCTAMLRLPPSWSRAEKMAELDRIVTLLRLQGCLHTTVGSGTVRGLSGGESKRLNIATELLSRPRLVFLDEPLTGRAVQDSSASAGSHPRADPSLAGSHPRGPTAAASRRRLDSTLAMTVLDALREIATSTSATIVLTVQHRLPNMAAARPDTAPSCYGLMIVCAFPIWKACPTAPSYDGRCTSPRARCGARLTSCC